MKKILFAAFLIAMLAIPAAVLASVPAVTVTADPAELSTGGEVTFKFTVNNASGASTIKDIKVDGNGLSAAPLEGTVDPGESKTFPKKLTLATSQLGQVLSFKVTWKEVKADLTETSGSATVTVTVKRANYDNPNCFCTVDKKQVNTGEQIKLTYTIRNEGTVVMKKISLTDKEIAGSQKLVDGLTLNPNEQHIITYTYTMKEATVISEGIVTYTPSNTNTELTYRMKQITLGMINSQVQFEVLQGETTQEGALFTIYITNNGNQTLKKLSVMDELGNKLQKDTFNLAVGEKKSFQHNVKSDAIRNVYFKVTGTDGAGQDFEDKTKSYEVRPYIDKSLVDMSIMATVLEQLSAEGSIKVHFDIKNVGKVDMSGVVLSEATYGEIKNLGTLAPGSYTVEESIYVGQPMDLTFTLTAKDTSGNPHTYSVYLKANYLGTATPAPSMDVDIKQDVNRMVGATLSDTLTILLVILAVLSAAAGVMLFSVSIAEQRAAERARARKKKAAARQYRHE